MTLSFWWTWSHCSDREFLGEAMCLAATVVGLIDPQHHLAEV